MADNFKKIEEMISNLVTKEDLKGLATKSDLDESINHLAETTAKGFEEMDQKFKDVHRKFAEIENNVASKSDLRYFANGINNRIDELVLNKVKYEEFDKLKKRVEVLEKS